MILGENMIPKIIHYCWFGKKAKPQKIQKCIDSWKKNMPDWKFVEWNENNFDVNSSPYVLQAYQERKYAFVSDVARIQALYKMGGFYLDTDVSVLKSFESLCEKKCIVGFEEKEYIATSFFACEKNHPLIKLFIDEYDGLQFKDADGKKDFTTNVTKFTNILSEMGLVRNGKYQVLDDDIEVYPQEYFSPYDYINCIDQSTDNTYCIHYYYVTWLPWQERCKKLLKRVAGKILGKEKMNTIRGCLKK